MSSAVIALPTITGVLGNLLPLKYGKSLPAASRDSSGSVPVFGSSGVVGSHSAALTTGPTIIVGRKGNVGAVHYSSLPCWPIDTAYFVEPPSGHNPAYYRYFLQSLNLVRLDKSTAIPGLSRDDYNTVEVMIHAPDQQDVVVAEIEKQFSRLDEAVANLQRVKANLKRYKAAVLKAAVEGRLVETEASLAHREGRSYETGEQLLQRIVGIVETNPTAKRRTVASEHIDCTEGWARASIGEVSEFTFYGPRFSSDAYSDKGAFVLRTTDIDESGRVDTSKAPRIDLAANDLAKYRVVPGDLLVTRTGSLGTVALFEDKLDAIPGAYLIQIRLRLDEHSRRFLLMFLKSPEGQARLTGGGAGVGRQNLNAPTITAIPFRLPPLAEQARIVAEVDRHLSIIREVEAEVDANLQRAQALRQATLAKAFMSRSAT